MDLVVAVLVVAVAAGLAIAALLLVRRHAPDGSYFHDGDRAAVMLFFADSGERAVVQASLIGSVASWSWPRRCS